MSRYNIIYLTTYIDKKLENRLSLPYTGAGLKKKQQLLDLLSQHKVEVVFVSMFSRFKNTIVKSFQKKIYNNITLRIPFFTKIPILNYIINPLMTFLELRKIYKTEGIDYIIVYNCVYENVIPAYFLHKLYKVKVICQYEDGWTISSKGYKKILYQLSHKIAEKISVGVIVNSTTFLDIFNKKDYFVFRGNIENKAIKFTHNIENKKSLNILFSSSIDDIRGTRLLIKLFNIIEDSKFLKDFSFHITGKGSLDMENELKNSIKKYTSNGGTAIFYGFISLEKLEELYMQSDILLALQEPDGKFSKYCFPSKIFEYYQYNKPIVTTNISDLKNNDFFNLEFIDYSIDALVGKLYELKENYLKKSKINIDNSSRLSRSFSIKENRIKMNKFLEDLE